MEYEWEKYTTWKCDVRRLVSGWSNKKAKKQELRRVRYICNMDYTKELDCYHHQHLFLRPAFRRQWVWIKYLHCLCSLVKSIALQVMLCPDLCYLYILVLPFFYIVVLACLYFFFLHILHVVPCVEFCQLAFSLYRSKPSQSSLRTLSNGGSFMDT